MNINMSYYALTNDKFLKSLDFLSTVFQIKNYVTLNGMDRQSSRVTETSILRSHIFHFLHLCTLFLWFWPNGYNNNVSWIYAILGGPTKT
jgi:hypothetical protein